MKKQISKTGKLLLDVVSSQNKTMKYYLKLEGVADFLAQSIYREILAPLGW